MDKPDDDTYKALARLSQDADWKLVAQWLLKCREACVQRSLSPDEVTCRQAQGQLQAIDRIFKETRAAESLARR